MSLIFNSKNKYKALWFSILLDLTILIPFSSLAELALGLYTFSYLPEMPLSNPTRLADGLKSYAFLSGVGGVAFGGIAESLEGFTINNIKYDPNRPDGERLLVNLKTPGGVKIEVIAKIPDWQLIPIARYANTDQHAAFTLFGELRDSKEAEIRRERGERILNYHPAFKDTLLGLRLFQADIMIFQPEVSDLPKIDGKYLLGKNENVPDISANRELFNKIQSLIKSYNKTHQSYVICDYNQQIIFSVSHNNLILSGNPYWYCWRTKDPEEIGQEKFFQILIEEMLSESEILSLERDLSEEDIIRYIERIFKNDSIMSRYFLEAMNDYSRSVSKKIKELGGVNPAVYNSLVATMRYSAFFRHVKSRQPERYRDFLSSLEGVQPKPYVKTPSVFIPNNL